MSTLPFTVPVDVSALRVVVSNATGAAVWLQAHTIDPEPCAIPLWRSDAIRHSMSAAIDLAPTVLRAAAYGRLVVSTSPDVYTPPAHAGLVQSAIRCNEAAS